MLSSVSALSLQQFSGVFRVVLEMQMLLTVVAVGGNPHNFTFLSKVTGLSNLFASGGECVYL